MSQKMKIYNDNVHPFQTTFKGDLYKINAKDYLKDASGKPVEWDLYEANDFRGQYSPILKDANELPDPRSYKMIRLEPVGKPLIEEKSEHVCMRCKHVSPSAEELEAHLKYRHADAIKLEIPEEDAKMLSKTKKAAT